jgi:hypothetical protein
MRDREAGVAPWLRWGPYLSERAWGTVREDYSAEGSAWTYFPHDHARSRAYRWNEDGLGGICDRGQYLCFALALWNGRDSILKERFFGLSGPEGNHGEDVKEYYYYLDSTPTHSYLKMLYKYPQSAFPYDELVAEGGRRGYGEPEFELNETGVFDNDRYFDVTIEYAKANHDDILIRLTAANRGAETADIWLVPTLWFRNTWSWGYKAGPMGNVRDRPALRATHMGVEADHPRLGRYHWVAESADQLLFTENDSNTERLYGASNPSPYVKDAFHRYLIHNDTAAVNPANVGTKAAAVHRLRLAPGEAQAVRLRLSAALHIRPFEHFDAVFGQRVDEADAFYDAIQPAHLSEDDRHIQRQALAGMLWSKQFYYYDVEQWLDGDPTPPPPPESRRHGRNAAWRHFNSFDIISMPDKWEYPWFAAWDLAFHAIPLAMVDPDFAKRQLLLMTRVWYQHPNGQLPAYEWSFDDVNPPVHAWAAYRVYRMEAERSGTGDRDFLERAFHKLLLNFTWWVNRKDVEGRNVFQGGFLGLDNISVFDRSARLPSGGHIDQSDGTAWMGFYSLTMMKIALELATGNAVYQDMATKFFEHFLGIAHAMTNVGGRRTGLWDETDGFFYDILHLPDDHYFPLRVRSLVGLIPLLAVETLEETELERMPEFRRRLSWFVRNKPHLSTNMASVELPGVGKRHLVAIPTRERLARVLRYMLDENEFLSPYGIRSLSRFHAASPFSIDVGGRAFSVSYEPAESRSGLYGGNSNWRGPVWLPINYLLIEALGKYHAYYGDSFTIEYPTGSGRYVTLDDVQKRLTQRLISLFRRDETGHRPIFGPDARFQEDSHWRDVLLFHEYFHGDSGLGLGASHQTGWTGLVADLIRQAAASAPERGPS